MEVLFGVGFGGGDAVKRFVEDADDSLLFGERGNTDKFAVNEVSVKGRNARATRKPLQIELLQKMKNEPWIIPVEVLHVKNSVERPKIFFDEKDVSDTAASASNDSRPANSALVVRVAYSAGAN